MAANKITPKWGTYSQAAVYCGLSTRLLEDLVKDGLIVSSLVRRPGCSRGSRLIDFRSLDSFILSGVGGKTDMTTLQRSSKPKGGA